jgi:hypothetical protein
MKNSVFLDHIKELADEKLGAYEQELKADSQERLAILKAEVKALDSEVSSVREYRKQVRQSRETFQKFIAEKFARQQQVEKLVKALWQQMSQEYFADEEHLAGWLEHSWQEVEISSGTVLVGTSEKQVRQLAGDRVSVEVDEDMGPGFVYENETVRVEHTLDSYLQDQYDRYKDVMYQLLTS